MECQTAREAVSARLDGEDVGVSPAERRALEEHLSGCAGCTTWTDSAVRLRRRMLAHAEPAAPDLSAQIIAAAMPPRLVRRSRRLRRERALRLVLALVGLLLVAGVTVVAILGPDVVAPAAHLTSTTGFWAGAVGLGFLAAAGWPHRAALLVAPLTTAVAFLVVASATNYVHHHHHPVHELPTLLAALGALALLAMPGPRGHRGARRSTDPADGRSPAAGALPIGSRLRA